MLPFMPEGLTAPVLRVAIEHATDRPCVAFQPEYLDLIRQLARYDTMTKLSDLSEAQPLHSLLRHVGRCVMVGNFVARR